MIGKKEIRGEIVGYGKIGKYEIFYRPGDRCSIRGPGISRSFSLPSDKELKERYQRESSSGRISGSLMTMLYHRAILENGTRSVPLGVAALGFKARSVGDDEINNAINEFWPGESEKLRSISEFKRMYSRVYNSAHKSHGGLRKVMEGVCPGLYRKAHRANNLSGDLDREALKEELLNRFYRGKPVNKTYLVHSQNEEEKNLARKIIVLSRVYGGILGRIGFTETIMRLTKLRREDIDMKGANSKRNATILEHLTEFLLGWAPLLGVDVSDFVDGSNISDLRRGKLERSFTYDDEKRGEADLRIGNRAIEVKGGFVQFSDSHELLLRYAPGLNSWIDGEKMDSSLLIFHQEEWMYKKILEDLKNAGVDVLGYGQFHDSLKKVIKGIEREYPQETREMKPRIADLDYLIRLHEELSFSPCNLMRANSVHRREWTLGVISGLNSLAREIKTRSKNVT